MNMDIGKGKGVVKSKAPLARLRNASVPGRCPGRGLISVSIYPASKANAFHRTGGRIIRIDINIPIAIDFQIIFSLNISWVERSPTIAPPRRKLNLAWDAVITKAQINANLNTAL
jgi:hypothetical protein